MFILTIQFGWILLFVGIVLGACFAQIYSKSAPNINEVARRLAISSSYIFAVGTMLVAIRLSFG